MPSTPESASPESAPSSPGPTPTTEHPRDPKKSPSFRRTFANRPFVLLWVAQLVSQSGDFIFEVALLWLVLELTHSAFAVGVIVTGTILPGVFLGPFLGVYIDRWDRRRTLIATNVVEGLVVAALSGLVLAGKVNLEGLFLVVLLLGAGASTVRTATNAYVPSVVPVDDLPPANGLLSISGSFNQIVGLSIGGIFVALFGVAIPIEYDALSFFAAAVLLMLIPRIHTGHAGTPSKVVQGFRAELAEGFAYIRQNRFMVELIVIGTVVNFFGNGISALIAPYTAFVLHGGPSIYGFLGASVAAGSLVGAIAVGRADTHRTAGIYLFGGGIGVGAAIFALGFAGTVPLGFGAMISVGVAIAVTNIPIGVVFQAKVPGRLLGRVSAAFGALISGTSPAGPLFAGWLAQRWGVEPVFLLSGIVIMAVIGLGALTMGSLRKVEY